MRRVGLDPPRHQKKVCDDLAEVKVAPHIVELLLNRRLGTVSNKTGDLISDVADICNLHHYLPEMREAVEKWENFLDALLAKEKSDPRDDSSVAPGARAARC